MQQLVQDALSEHINGLQLAQEDLKKALELDPQNVEVRKLWARAKALQKEADASASLLLLRKQLEREADESAREVLI